MRYFVFLFSIPLLMLFGTGCSEDKMQMESLVPLFAELRIATQHYGHSTAEARAARIEILHRHGFTLQQFQSQTETLKANPKLWLQFQQTLVDHLDSLARPDTTAKRDSTP